MLHTLNHKVKVTLPKVHIGKHEHHFSVYQLLAFGIVFAAIGAYFLFGSFASTATFGTTTVGSSCDTFAGDTKRVNRYSVGTTATVSQLSIYLQPGTAAGSQALKGVLYADNNGTAGSLIATTNQLMYTNTEAKGWYTLSFSKQPTLNPGNYWLGVLSGTTARAAGYCYVSASSNVRDLNANQFSAGPSNPFGPIASMDNRYMSLYASYSTSSTNTTFGKTTIGASCDTFTNDWKRVNRYSLGTSALVSQLNIYLKPGTVNGSQPLQGVLYSDNNGAPGSLIAATNQLDYSNTNPAGWYSLPFAAPPSLNPGAYWIGVLSGSTARAAGYCYDTASSNVRDYNANTFTAGPSSPFGSISQDNRIMSLSATYTSTNGNPSTPTVSLTATPSAITAGQSSTLSWTSTNATACAASWTTNKATSGSQSVSPQMTSTYAITCSGSGGSASTSTTVSVSSSGGNQSPTVSLSANPSSITAGQSSTLSWTSTNATACAASWTTNKATSGSQSVSPASTTTYTMSCSGTGGSSSATASVSVSSPGGGGIACKTTLSGSQTAELLANAVHLQSNEWASGAPFSICTDGNADFQITTSGINNSTSGAPGAYPSLYKGCHWGYCTTNSGLPVVNSTLIGTPGKVTTSYNTSVISSGAWDDAYDNWYNPNSTTNSNNTGLEMMIWINHHGPIQPAGSVASNNASIDGMSWTVWHGGSSPGGTVSYVLNSPTTAVTNMDLGPFTADSVNRGYMTSSWYLIDVEAGFEPWQGGQGLTANSFNVTVH